MDRFNRVRIKLGIFPQVCIHFAWLINELVFFDKTFYAFILWLRQIFELINEFRNMKSLSIPQAYINNAVP